MVILQTIDTVIRSRLKSTFRLMCIDFGGMEVQISLVLVIQACHTSEFLIFVTESLFLGHAVDMREVGKRGGHLSMLYVEWQKLLGSVFVVFIVNREIVLCLEPAFVKAMMITSNSKKPKQFYETAKYLFGQRFLGGGILTQLNNIQWAKQRKMMNPAFRRGYLKELMGQYNDSVDELMTYLKQKADGKTEILMAQQFNKVSLDIIAKVAFGEYNLNVISDDAMFLNTAIEDTFDGIGMQLKLSFFSRIDPRKEARDRRNKIKCSCAVVRNFGRKCIMRRIQAMKDGRDYPHDILTHILSTYQDQDSITEYNISHMIDEFATFFVAGQETTAQLMSFTCEYVGRHPQVYQKLKEETDEVIGSKTFISYEDTCQLKYMNLVLKEVLRIAPPVTGVQRTNEEDIIVNGLKIPAGSNISLNTYALGRDERFWDEPEVFNPERFREKNSRHMYAYFPFSLGPRVCIGQQFALLEAKVVLAKFLQLYKFTLVPNVQLKTYIAGTLKPVHKTPLYLNVRRENVRSS
ncbi:cholesterol 24-hydroxylase-like isoform X1 [Apostichopus japonicus]|uniref:cholesterol 24-hydroxylase-like isoform X1 n=2 Tax=Stichopus japonicus TaxID=307972 RepID=UPI003AB306BA